MRTTISRSKGDGGPLLGLLVWPATDNAKDYLTPAGTRRRLTTLARGGSRQPVLQRQQEHHQLPRTTASSPTSASSSPPFSWGNLKTNIGVDNYTNQNLILRHPESALGHVQRHSRRRQRHHPQSQRADAAQLQQPRAHEQHLDQRPSRVTRYPMQKSTTDALKGQDFLDPNFVSINNTNLQGRTARPSRSAGWSAPSAGRRSPTRAPVPDGDGPERLDLDDPAGSELVLLSLDFVELHLLRRVPGDRPPHDRKAPCGVC